MIDSSDFLTHFNLLEEFFNETSQLFGYTQRETAIVKGITIEFLSLPKSGQPMNLGKENVITLIVIFPIGKESVLDLLESQR